MTPAPFAASSFPAGGSVPRLYASLADLPQLLARRAGRASGIAKGADRVGLVLLILASGVLLFRPTDLIPALADAPIHMVLVTACLLVSLPRVWETLSARSMRENAVMALLLLLIPAVMLSHLSHLNTYDARLGGGEMAKAFTFFVLVVALVDSVRKMEAMFLAVTVSVCALTVVALLQYHGVVHLDALMSVEQRAWDPSDPVPLVRLCGLGVFNDPNDFSLLLVAAMIACAYWLNEWGVGRWRWLLLAPLALFVYGLMLTHSRGGLISAVAATLAFLPARYGWRNAMPLALVAVPVLIALAWGRQTTVDLDDPEDTFQTRLQLWNASLDVFRSSPLFGIGQGKLFDTIGQVSHNSYLHAFAEMGVLGGTAFIGAFYFVMRSVWRAAPAEGGLSRMRPYVLALAVGYGAGLLSLSRCYTVPTQFLLALATAYLLMVSRAGGGTLPRFEWACIRRSACVGAIFLLATYLFVRFMILGGW